MNEEFTICSNESHKASGSKYPKDTVPIELFNDKNSDKLYKYCKDCRNYYKSHQSAYRKKTTDNKKYDEAVKNNADVIHCLSDYHDNTIYPKDKVPRKLFEKENSDELYKHCENCRIYQTKRRKETKQLKLDIHKKEIENNSEYISCLSSFHDNTIHPKHKVPRKLFLKNPEIPNSALTKYCSNCKNYRAKDIKEKRKTNRIKAENKGLYYCATCNNEVNKLEIGVNIDSTLSNNCQSCCYKKTALSKIHKQNFIKLKHEYIQNYQSCCYLCNNIFIVINNITLPIPTKIINNIRYIEYNGTLYTSKFFIDNYSDIINVYILHFDHLSEKEQRERKIIGPNESFLAKTSDVPHMSSDIKMRYEASKCQLICGKCHIVETMRREDEKRIEIHGNKTIKQKTGKNLDQKRNYINELKKQGCSVCNYVNIDLPRFFHFDHIDPTTKINNISEMTHQSKYSFDHLVAETNKCRIICMHCHMCHTKDQWNNDIYRKKKEPKPILQDLIVTNKKHTVKIIQYDKNNNFIEEYKSISGASRLCNIPRDKLYKILDNKVEHKEFIFKRSE